MATIFTEIIGGIIPSHKIAETEDYYAFLDINPLAKGHTLVVPKLEVDNIFDLEDDVLAGLHVFAKKVAKCLDAVMDCKRVGVLVIGTEVPHAHIHLIPFQNERQMAITSPKLNLSREVMEQIAMSASASYDALYNEVIDKVTLVFGASAKVERYSNKAMKMLQENGNEVVAIGGRVGEAHDIEIMTGHPELNGIDTVTMYMGEDRQVDHENYILSLKPRRIIFNPGAENELFAKRARAEAVQTENACTLVMLRTGQY